MHTASTSFNHSFDHQKSESISDVRRELNRTQRAQKETRGKKTRGDFSCPIFSLVNFLPVPN